MSYANDMPTADLRTDAGLASELRAGVMRLRRRLATERHPDNDLSIGQMVVLGLLVRLGDQTVGELARAERVQPPSMTRTVNCLESDGYVVRRAARDRRAPGRGRRSPTPVAPPCWPTASAATPGWPSSSPGSPPPSAPPCATPRRSSPDLP